MENLIIAKKDLIDGHFYLNKNFGRGMRIGMWSKDSEMFICIRYKFGWQLYEMEHEEDDKGFTIFQPILDITEEIDNNYPAVEPKPFKKG